MVDMKGAVKAAIVCIQEFYPGGEIRLEEVSPGDHAWSVVLSLSERRT
jgi:hypothetical protein